jgi:hypothetical protein
LIIATVFIELGFVSNIVYLVQEYIVRIIMVIVGVIGQIVMVHIRHRVRRNLEEKLVHVGVVLVERLAHDHILERLSEFGRHQIVSLDNKCNK